jgi:hypothetical protein
MLGLLSAALVLAILPATVSAATSPITIHAELGECQWFGDFAGNKKTIVFLWRDSAGKMKSTQRVRSQASGRYDTRCDFGEAIEVGDTIKATIGNKSHTFTIPRLTLASNRADDTVWGYGPANSSVDVRFTSIEGFWTGSTAFAHNTPTDANGLFSYDFTSEGDIRGWDQVEVESPNAHGDIAFIQTTAPTLKLYVGRPDRRNVWGYVAPGTSLEVDLLDSGHIQKAIAAGGVDRFGYFETDFIAADMGFVRAIAGDFVDATASIGADATWQIPAIPVTIRASSDKVSGTCLPNDGWQVNARSNVADRNAFVTGMTNASGNFSTDLTSQMNLQRGDKVNVYCKLPSGDVVARFVTVP